uniref:Uncharacterized protein n=1 Tax=Curvibacter symbiont subsp. Hydra magnipapillata TaxID=667019 RepID=C9Y8F4_CURXX|nr:hypothetical protein Csp_A04050 [Curvibacter putative symbiont of Hydra magnipapillata]
MICLRVGVGAAGRSPQITESAWATERFAQVKEEPAKRAGDTEQNDLSPKRSAHRKTARIFKKVRA